MRYDEEAVTPMTAADATDTTDMTDATDVTDMDAADMIGTTDTDMTDMDAADAADTDATDAADAADTDVTEADTTDAADPLVTVIIPAHDAQRYLDRCMRSVVGQRWRRIGIIVVDDGSTDATAAICDDWARRDDRITVVHQPNRGVSAARNHGMALARGRYLMFVDADDELAPDAVATAVARAEQSGADVVCFDYQPFDDTGSLPRRTVAAAAFPTMTACGAHEALRQLHGGHISNFVWMFLWSAPYLRERARRFAEDIGYGEDVLFINQALAGASVVAFVPRALYRYRHGHASVSTTKTVGHAQDDIAVVGRLDALLLGTPQERDYRPYRTGLLIAAYAILPWRQGPDGRRVAASVRRELLRSLTWSVVLRLSRRQRLKLMLIAGNVYAPAARTASRLARAARRITERRR